MNQSTKKSRIMETVEMIINQLPPQNKLIILPFFPQFRAWLDEMPEENIDSFINEVKKRIDYIEYGKAEQIEP